MGYLLPISAGFLSGYLLKFLVNWIDIDNYKINNNNYMFEIICPIPWVWSFSNLPLFDALIFSFITVALIGISFADFYTMQIPLIFVIMGAISVLIAIFKKSIYLSSAAYGIFVGAIIPLMIMGLMWLITKRQGMGFGDIQLGFVLGAWL